MSGPGAQMLGYKEIHAEYLPGVPVGTLRYLQSRGDLPPSIVVGRRRVWRRADIETWINGMFEGAA